MSNYRAGYVGLIGRPNAGKSTLLNALLGEKLSIVSRKPQTTRQRICGIYSSDQGQIVFLDAPGVIHAESGLNRFLKNEYEAVIEDSDFLVAVLNLDAKKQEELSDIISLVESSGKPWGAIITKCDMRLGHRKPWILQQLGGKAQFVIEVSARNRPQDTQDEVIPQLIPKMPESAAPLFDPEVYTTHNMREIAAEVVREKCFDFLHAEIPYGLAVLVNKYEEGENLDRIFASIYLSKEAHRAMVIGQGGAKLKRIGQAARLDIEKILGKKVYLDLHVSVKKNWMKNPMQMEEFGYVHNS
ncbi:MAG: GTPase Era [Bdellovibrionales bacterium]